MFVLQFQFQLQFQFHLQFQFNPVFHIQFVFVYCSLVNPSDCVDMDCDAHKKVIIQDVDGSLLGSPGTVIPDSAFEWDGRSKAWTRRLPHPQDDADHTRRCQDSKGGCCSQ